MSQIDLTDKEAKLLRKANHNHGIIMFYLLILAICIVTPLQLHKLYQVGQMESPTIRDYTQPWLIIAIHIILLRKNMKVRSCMRLVTKLKDALPSQESSAKEA